MSINRFGSIDRCPKCNEVIIFNGNDNIYFRDSDWAHIDCSKLVVGDNRINTLYRNSSEETRSLARNEYTKAASEGKSYEEINQVVKKSLKSKL